MKCHTIESLKEKIIDIESQIYFEKSHILDLEKEKKSVQEKLQALQEQQEYLGIGV